MAAWSVADRALPSFKAVSMAKKALRSSPKDEFALANAAVARSTQRNDCKNFMDLPASPRSGNHSLLHHRTSFAVDSAEAKMSSFPLPSMSTTIRSEEHTSELQS